MDMKPGVMSKREYQIDINGRAPRFRAPRGARRGNIGFPENEEVKPPRRVFRGYSRSSQPGVWGYQSPSK